MSAKRKAVIVGGGVAAFVAAWELIQDDVAVVIASPTDPGHWPTVAAGGLPLGDDVAALVADTRACGEYASPEAPVQALARAASGLVDDLERVGVPFERDANGPLLRRLPGMHAPGAVFVSTHTEMAISAALERTVYAAGGPRLRILPPVKLCRFMVVDGQCIGVVVQSVLDSQVEAVEADVVLVVGGGPERMLGAQSGHLCPEAPLAIAARAGALLVDLHRCQQRPVVLVTDRGLVVPSAAVRSEGARLWVPKKQDDTRPPHEIPNKERRRFLDEAHPGWAELVPDRLAAQRVRERGGSALLDLSHFPEAHLEARLGAELEALRLATRLDPARTALPVEAAPLGLLGGIRVDHEEDDAGELVADSARNHATSIAGLYAAAGAASLYHGSCELGGNRLLADLFGGRTAGRAMTIYLDELNPVKQTEREAAVDEAVELAEAAHEERVESGFGEAHDDIFAELSAAIRDVLGPAEYELSDTAAELDALGVSLTATQPEARAGETGASSLFALENMLLVAQMAAHTAVTAERHASSAKAKTLTRLFTRVVGDAIEVDTAMTVDGRTVSGALPQPAAERTYGDDDG